MDASDPRCSPKLIVQPRCAEQTLFAESPRITDNPVPDRVRFPLLCSEEHAGLDIATCMGPEILRLGRVGTISMRFEAHTQLEACRFQAQFEGPPPYAMQLGHLRAWEEPPNVLMRNVGLDCAVCIVRDSTACVVRHVA